jgi:hypothetical protein
MTSTPHAHGKQVKEAIASGPRPLDLEAKTSELNSTIKAILAPLASLRITVVLFVMAIFLILAGTLAQVDYGIWTVMETYFRTWVAKIEVQIFMPNEWAKKIGVLSETGEASRFPFPGGFIIGGAMVINLVAAHAVRFKIVAKKDKLYPGLVFSAFTLAVILFAVIASTKTVWPLQHPMQFGPSLALAIAGIIGLCVPSYLLYGKRTGIVLMHAGVILLLVNELVTGLGAYEGRLEIKQQGVNNFTYNLEAAELAFIDGSDPKNDKVVALSQALMERSAESGQPIRDARLPFDVKVEKFHKNSKLAAVTPEELTRRKDPADAGEVRNVHDSAGNLVKVYTAEGIKVGTGADGSGVADIGSAYVTLLDKASGKKVGTYLVSSFFTATIGEELMDTVAAEGKKYQFGMRFAREYKPYTMHLVEFRHDKFTGTDKARNFSSQVMLIDEDHPQGRESLISMNAPLRYRGETFFQAAFLPRNEGTILQVVRNPGYLLPYIACIVVAIGMVWHFLGHLTAFVRRVLK